MVSPLGPFQSSVSWPSLPAQQPAHRGRREQERGYPWPGWGLSELGPLELGLLPACSPDLWSVYTLPSGRVAVSLQRPPGPRDGKDTVTKIHFCNAVMDKHCFNKSFNILMNHLFKGYKLTSQLFIIIGVGCISFRRGLDFLLGRQILLVFILCFCNYVLSNINNSKYG